MACNFAYLLWGRRVTLRNGQIGVVARGACQRNFFELSERIEQNIRLPDGVSALPGALHGAAAERPALVLCSSSGSLTMLAAMCRALSSASRSVAERCLQLIFRPDDPRHFRFSPGFQTHR
jgi:hypothetical protein